MNSVAVVGAGSWGTGLAWLLAQRNEDVRLWARDPDLAERVSASRVNEAYLPELRLPDPLAITAELDRALEGAGLVVVAVPSVGLATVAARMAAALAVGATVISATKGLDHATGRRMTLVLADALPAGVGIGALSGPNLSSEIVAGQPAASVVASADPAVMGVLQTALSSRRFRVYTNPDVAGVELGGALKNPYAIAAGISDGLGYGDNTKAALMTRGMHEMRRLGVALGADPRTFAGLCGFGDLLATCHSRQSRNRNLGEQLGRGARLGELLAGTPHVAEGVPTTRTALRLAHEQGVHMPILEELHAILFEDKPPRDAVAALMLRDVSDELGAG
ncbi:MAG: NAD(P)-dependent glycerol-3-phosphate dehydrogenase [Armatimonadetes bacterium]|nr:NAD(P)-dependent glycerol-3-phosphate dehydrogenase [Armatimonadota bacterium]